MADEVQEELAETPAEQTPTPEAETPPVESPAEKPPETPPETPAAPAEEPEKEPRWVQDLYQRVANVNHVLEKRDSQLMEVVKAVSVIAEKVTPKPPDELEEAKTLSDEALKEDLALAQMRRDAGSPEEADKIEPKKVPD